MSSALVFGLSLTFMAIFVVAIAIIFIVQRNLKRPPINVPPDISQLMDSGLRDYRDDTHEGI